MSNLMFNGEELLSDLMLSNGRLKKVWVSDSIEIDGNKLETTDNPTPIEQTIPDGAIDITSSFFNDYFINRAQPGFFGSTYSSTSKCRAVYGPGDVFVTRVPLAYLDSDGKLQHDKSWVTDEEAAEYGISAKFMDQPTEEHEQSTDTTEGNDPYVGKRWVFYWEKCNYKKDEFGNKYITAIKGFKYNGKEFTENPDITTGENVGVFGPTFWYFCTEDKGYGKDGKYLTDDKTKDGKPLFQLWGISDKPYQLLSDSKKKELAAHGVGETDFNIWNECLIWDNTAKKYQERPYWVHSAYPSVYEYNSSGTDLSASYPFFSAPNRVQKTQMSYYTVNNISKYAPGSTGETWVNSFITLFDIIKNGTKNSDTSKTNSKNVHRGIINYYPSGDPYTMPVDLKDAGYIVPISRVNYFEKNGTILLHQSTYTNQTSNNSVYKNSYSEIIARVKSIDTITVTLLDDTTQEQLCLILDEDTVPRPFYIRTTADAAKELSHRNNYAFSAVSVRGVCLTGETNLVIGKHDGSATSNTNDRHPFRVQGTEYGTGTWQVPGDALMIFGDGTEITINKTYYEYLGDPKKVYKTTTLTPSSDQYIYLYAPQSVTRKCMTSNVVSDWINAGYIPVGVIDKGSNCYIANISLDGNSGLSMITLKSGSSSSTTGVGAYNWVGTADPAEILSFGNLRYGDQCGSAARVFNSSLSHTFWGYGARD